MLFSSNKTYTIGPVRTLIDLNQGRTGVNVQFEAIASEKSPFAALVIDQKTLDNTSPSDIEYKNVQGELSGSVDVHGGEYYLILVAQNETNVSVSIQGTALETKLPPFDEPDGSTPPSLFVSDTTLYAILGLFVVAFVAYYVYSKQPRRAPSSSFTRQSLLSKLRNAQF